MAQSANARQADSSPFRVDPDAELPVGTQLEWRLRALIASGRLAAGDRLPSVRAMAEWAGVNVNTVRSVYSGLESDGLVATQHGSGTFVADRAASPALERIATEAIRAAREIGADPEELARLTFVVAGLPDDGAALPSNTETPGTPAALPATDTDERGARQELRRQIGRLEGELASHARELIPPSEPRSRPAPGRLVGTAELERTRDELLDRLAEARAAAETRGARERRARELRDEMMIDPAAHRWESVSDAEMGEEGCRDYTVEAGPLGSLMSWWRLKVSGGCPLAGSE